MKNGIEGEVTMAVKTVIRKCGMTFNLFEKSIQVACETGATFIFYGRTPTNKDVEDLYEIYKLGRKQYKDDFEKAKAQLEKLK